jgi:hypothetical protein
MTLPLLCGFTVADSGPYCHAIFRIARGRVIGLNDTSDNDDLAGRDGVWTRLSALRRTSSRAAAATAARVSYGGAAGCAPA